MDAIKAMQFAHERHAGQKRRYTGAPYTDHLAEVAGIVAATFSSRAISVGGLMRVLCVAWLHDTLEDTKTTGAELVAEFGQPVADDVMWLTDIPLGGSRAERKASTRARLAQAPARVQTIKVADILSNTSSIVQHDPSFGRVYLEEKRLLLDVLIDADPRLVAQARAQIAAVRHDLEKPRDKVLAAIEAFHDEHPLAGNEPYDWPDKFLLSTRAAMSAALSAHLNA